MDLLTNSFVKNVQNPALKGQELAEKTAKKNAPIQDARELA